MFLIHEQTRADFRCFNFLNNPSVKKITLNLYQFEFLQPKSKIDYNFEFKK